uniref:Uncharacterized protein n=1 Tax=Arundo donax TaxID=35708 RepID=A0A0A9H097_ARUDO
MEQTLLWHGTSVFRVTGSCLFNNQTDQCEMHVGYPLN